MEIRFYLDPDTGQPHVYNHGITVDEVRQIFAAPCEDLAGDRGSRMRFGQTEAGRYLQVIYARGKIPGTVFVITAYELKGKAKKAHRRRQRRKGR